MSVYYLQLWASFSQETSQKGVATGKGSPDLPVPPLSLFNQSRFTVSQLLLFLIYSFTLFSHITGGLPLKSGSSALLPHTLVNTIFHYFHGTKPLQFIVLHPLSHLTLKGQLDLTPHIISSCWLVIIALESVSMGSGELWNTSCSQSEQRVQNQPWES